MTYEFAPIIQHDDGTCERCEEGLPDFWSVYYRGADGLAMCLMDLQSGRTAMQLTNRLNELEASWKLA
jgi:hypothetical protein